MSDPVQVTQKSPRVPWNKGKLIGAKPPLRSKHVWSIRTRLQVGGRTRDLAMFNLAIDSKLRGCDVVAIKVEDIAPHGYTADRATVRQKKTGRPVRFELTELTRQALDDYIRLAGKKTGEFLFVGRRGQGQCMTTRQYARLVSEWIGSIGLDPLLFGTHSLRRTKATLIYRRTGNLRAVQILLETPTNCPCTPERRNDSVSVSSALRRDGRHTATAGALRRRHGRRATARYVGRAAAGVDAERISSARDIAIHTTFSP